MIKVTALGDSLTKGVILTEANRYSFVEQSYLDIVSRELDMQISNYGRFGSTIDMGDSMVRRHSDEIAGSEYTFIEYGGNDCDFDSFYSIFLFFQPPNVRRTEGKRYSVAWWQHRHHIKVA